MEIEFRLKKVLQQHGKDRHGVVQRMASELSNPYRRDDSLEYVLGKWLAEDRAAAETAIRESEELSETARWRLLEGGDYGH